MDTEKALEIPDEELIRPEGDDSESSPDDQKVDEQDDDVESAEW